MTPDELALLSDASALLGRLGPTARADVDAAAREAERAAEQERYAAEIAERAERLARDPEFQALHAENARRAEREAPRRDRAPQGGGGNPDRQVEQGQRRRPIPAMGAVQRMRISQHRGDALPRPGGSYLCSQRRAIHKLQCDDSACRSRRGSYVSTLCGDGLYRCPACLPLFVQQWNADQAAGNDPASRRSAAAARTMATPGAFG